MDPAFLHWMGGCAAFTRAHLQRIPGDPENAALQYGALFFSFRNRNDMHVSCDLVAREIFMKYTDENFPFLFGRRGTIDPKGFYLSMVCGDSEIEEQSM